VDLGLRPLAARQREQHGGGPITGERWEFHPLNGIAVQREASARSSRGDTETEVFISNMGDAAHAVEQCALSHRNSDGTYDSGYKACATDEANRLQPLEKSFRFFVAAPPKPARGAALRYRIVNRMRGGSGSQTVRKRPTGPDVSVKLRGAKHVVRYGKSFFVGWSEPPRQAPNKPQLRVDPGARQAGGGGRDQSGPLGHAGEYERFGERG
jgi:hypothetical protein